MTTPFAIAIRDGLVSTLQAARWPYKTDVTAGQPDTAAARRVHIDIGPTDMVLDYYELRGDSRRFRCFWTVELAITTGLGLTPAASHKEAWETVDHALGVLDASPQLGTEGVILARPQGVRTDDDWADADGRTRLILTVEVETRGLATPS